MKFSNILVCFRSVVSLVVAAICVFSWAAAAFGQPGVTTTTVVSPDPKTLFNSAIHAYKSGEDSTAIADLRIYLGVMPNDGPAVGLLGFLELKDGGQDTQAVLDLQNAVKLQPKDRSTRNNLGSALLRTGNVSGAISQFKTVLEYDPDDIVAETNLAGAEAQGGHYADAAQLYDRIVAQGSVSPAVYKDDGYCKGKLGDAVAAAALYIKATKLDMDDASSWIGAGLYSSRSGDNTEAIEDLAKAIELGPSDPFQARFVYGETLAKVGRLDDALKQFRYASVLNPQDFSTYYNIGVIENRLEDYDDAEDAFKQALVLEPGNPDASAGLALIAGRKGAFDTATAQLQEIAQANPYSSAVQAALGTLYSEQDEGEQAVQHWKSALTLNPADDETRLQLATYYVSIKDYKSAIFEYEFLTRRDPKNDAIQNARGLSYEAIGQHNAAQAAFADAVFANPKNAAAWNNLGVTDEELSNTSEAVSAYKKALAVEPGLNEAKENIARLSSGTPTLASPPGDNH